jgi:hypothetical protein
MDQYVTSAAELDLHYTYTDIDIKIDTARTLKKKTNLLLQ